MLIRGAAGRKIPYGRIKTNDGLYFIENDAAEELKPGAMWYGVLNSDKMTRAASIALVDAHQD